MLPGFSFHEEVIVQIKVKYHPAGYLSDLSKAPVIAIRVTGVTITAIAAIVAGCIAGAVPGPKGLNLDLAESQTRDIVAFSYMTPPTWKQLSESARAQPTLLYSALGKASLMPTLKY